MDGHGTGPVDATTESVRRRITIVGATGRMGQLTRQIVADDPELVAHQLLDSSSRLEELDTEVDVVIDFTRHDVSRKIVHHCVSRNLPVLVGSSGWTRADLQDVREEMAHSSAATVCVVPNFSIGVVALGLLATYAASVYEVAEIVETHDISKVDAPSGTAIWTAEMISSRLTSKDVSGEAESRGLKVGHVPLHSVRLPGGPDAQTIYFASEFESAEVSYRTTSTMAYWPGLQRAIHAISPGMGMRLGLEQVIDLGLPRPTSALK